MFRKVKKKSGLLRKRPERRDGDENANDNDDEDADDVSLAIRQTQKKQKILASLPLASGSAVSASGGVGGSHKSFGKQQQQHQQQLSSPDKTELSILASKHKQNMEEYIAKKIQATIPNIANNGNDTIMDHFNDMDNPHIRRDGDDEEDLYQQLSRETYRGGDNKSLLTSHEPPHRQDDDKGAGGAMLVGSGIAEVILPTQTRLSSATTNIVRNKHTLSSSSAIPKGTNEVLPLTTPKPIGRSMVHQQQPQQPVHANSTNNFNSNDNHSPEAAETTAADSKRAGFDAIIRGRPTNNPSKGGGESNTTGQSSTSFPKKRNRDDQAFSNFINKQFDSSHRRF